MVLFHPDLTLGAMEDKGGAPRHKHVRVAWPWKMKVGPQGMDMLGFPGHRGSLLFWLTVYFLSVVPAF